MDVTTLKQINKELRKPRVGRRVQIPIVCSAGNPTSDIYLSYVRYHIDKISIPSGQAFSNPCNLVVGSNRVIENMRVFGATDGSPNTVECDILIDPGEQVFFEATPPAAAFIGTGRVTFLLLGWIIN